MWCKNCRQDTPGIRSPRQPGMRCGRCGGMLGPEASAAATSGHPAEIGLDLGTGPGASATSGAHAGNTFEDWQLDQNLRSLEARLGPFRRPQPAPPASRTPQWRFDAAHTSVPAPRYERRRKRLDRPAHRSGLWARCVIWLGLIALVAAGGVVGWSIVDERPEFWRAGLALAGGGGVIFLLGLVWQLERIWRNSRFAVQKLRQLDTQIRQLEQTTSMLGVTQGSASQSFYTHMAEGANPHMLLADLKGQLDLLAMNFARR